MIQDWTTRFLELSDDDIEVIKKTRICDLAKYPVRYTLPLLVAAFGPLVVSLAPFLILMHLENKWKARRRGVG